MPPEDSSSPSRPKTPVPKLLHGPLPTTPHRTTSSLSAISVEAHPPSSSSSTPTRPLLSSQSRHASSSTLPSAPVVARPTVESGTPSSSKSSSSDLPLPLPLASPGLSMRESRDSGTSTPSSLSRKGKERAAAGTVEETEVEVEGEMALRVGGGAAGQAERGLRELVRRGTVGEKEAGSRGGSRSRGASIKGELHTLDPPPRQGARNYSPRRYYVLTHAGKPVFRSHDDSSEDNITNLMGVAQALISIFAEDDDRIRCIMRGHHRIAFVLKSPLYLFCVSDWGEPEHILRIHLEYIHLQILSVVSSTQLARVFQRRSNFDLSRLLEGTDKFLQALVDRCQYDFSYLTSTLQPLRMAPAVRDTAAAALMPPAKFKDLLYVLLIAGDHIVTLLRPRKHSIHPSDLHLLLNTLAASSTLRTAESWLPICLPKFNPAGFVHAYVSYVLPDVGLVFISADREAFEELRAWKDVVLEKLEKEGTLKKIEQSIESHPYSVSAVGCPGLRHFVYKSRQNVQVTAPEWEGPYAEDGPGRKRLVTLYHRLHDAVHARSGQSSPLKLVYIRTEEEAALAWITKPFELYLCMSPQMSKSAVVGAANAVAKWVAAEEGKVFLRDAPVF